ncbi:MULTISPECIES: trehalose-phosphatase [Rubrivivax]|uniref:Trehalose 6-phosphate phosphatase n=1 Tax=Rubrivivax benzoatilyticus TaxID=316997 RepID=A0ABX0HU24_9BURK|nr:MULTISPECIES: trehalose-phosphatase [Rubrivivax]MCD0416681.1 trehalose-phosphatase [Rubrivivax sp. JA1024]EGJ12120.1 trehalose-phosphatase [Rubrivivax benzoatilyticus JA2 = ATCC BAA-35]MCC9597344.1 trehalose-phosphatase [Rubrivivax sp. JA1055]MCC9646399.1 trehalose-phosphatase [Rubrivivax sp. JA1029]NHK98525.1 trehalose-phosphatase [Rubrivivax benzoatilyticus]
MNTPRRHLFSPEGHAAFDALCRRDPLLAFDFDGTLAPIVARPEDARISAALSRRLAQLAARRPLAIVTGRAVDDVRPRLGFEPGWIVGNHGAENTIEPASAETLQALDTLRQRLADAEPALAAAGVRIEDKQHSFALHYRLARDRDAALAEIDARLGTLDTGLRRFGGKCVVNVVGADAPDKADAVFSLVAAAGCDSALFVGDDLNDEVVFERAPLHWLTLRVGREPTSQARFFLDSQSEVAQLLEQLLAQLPERR